MPRVQLLDHQPDWAHSFEAVAAELKHAFEPQAVRVEHIGSTAVEGLCPKPVIDVLVGLHELSAATSSVSKLAAAGYQYRPEYEDELPERRYFVGPEQRQNPRRC